MLLVWRVYATALMRPRIPQSVTCGSGNPKVLIRDTTWNPTKTNCFYILPALI